MKENLEKERNCITFINAITLGLSCTGLTVGQVLFIYNNFFPQTFYETFLLVKKR